MSGSELWIDRAIPHPAVGKRSWTQSGRRQRTPLRFGQQERSQNQQAKGAAGNNADQRLMKFCALDHTDLRCRGEIFEASRHATSSAVLPRCH
jgi:hypothetical protein